MKTTFGKMIAALLILTLLAVGALADTSVLPASLTTLDAEALKNTALTGVLDLSGTQITEIANGALDGLSLQGLILPASIAYVGRQNFAKDPIWVYVEVNEEYECAAPDLNGLGNVHYLISDLGNDGKITCADFIYKGEAQVENGFWYYLNDGAGTMLCAYDNTRVPSAVYVPDEIDGTQIIGISDFAFSGCGQVSAISLPENMYVPDMVVDDVPDAEIINRHALRIWADTGLQAVHKPLVEQFFAESDEYPAWSWSAVYQNIGANNADYLLEDNGAADIYMLPQDQIARLYQNQTSLLSPVSASAVSGQDASALEAATLNGQVVAYPLSSDNGYFLFYDPEVVQHPGDLDAMLQDCEEHNALFAMNLSSGWYNMAFFFGAGCTVEYPLDGDPNIHVTGSAGLTAMKAMIRMANSPAFLNDGSAASAQAYAAGEGKTLGAIVTGMWDAGSLSGYSASKLPAFDGHQMGSFSGCRYLGVNPTNGAEKTALAHQIAAMLTSEPVQVQLYNTSDVIPSRAAARNQITLSAAARALADQNVYATPQGPYPGAYWGVAQDFGQRIVNGECNGLSDSELSALLSQFQQDLEGVTEE